MRFTAVTDPELFKPKYDLEAELSEFMKMNVKVAEVSYGNRYKTPGIASTSLNAAAKRYFFPIRAYCKKRKVYLMRVDMK